MARRLWAVSLFAAFLLLVAAAGADPPKLPENIAGPRTARMLAEVHWSKSMEACCDQARREGKLVFWIHMLGDMNGFT